MAKNTQQNMFYLFAERSQIPQKNGHIVLVNLKNVNIDIRQRTQDVISERRKRSFVVQSISTGFLTILYTSSVLVLVARQCSIFVQILNYIAEKQFFSI